MSIDQILSILRLIAPFLSMLEEKEIEALNSLVDDAAACI